MKHKACYHSCKRSLLGQKYCIPVPLVPRMSLIKHWRSLKAPGRLRNPTAARGFLPGSPTENHQTATLKFYKTKKTYWEWACPNRQTGLNTSTWSVGLPSYGALIAVNSNTPCHRRWARHLCCSFPFWCCTLHHTSTDGLVCAIKLSQIRELLLIFLLGFSATVPWHDSLDGCRSSYISPSERLAQSPELEALEPSMKPMPQSVLEP